jgi:hypothetical protein
VIIYNPNNSPVVYSEDGRILGGDDRIEVDSLDRHGERALAHGYLMVLDEEKAEEEAAPAEEEDAPGVDANAPAKPARRPSAKGKAKDGDSGASDGSETA